MATVTGAAPAVCGLRGRRVCCSSSRVKQTGGEPGNPTLEARKGPGVFKTPSSCVPDALRKQRVPGRERTGTPVVRSNVLWWLSYGDEMAAGHGLAP